MYTNDAKLYMHVHMRYSVATSTLSLTESMLTNCEHIIQRGVGRARGREGVERECLKC